MIYYTTAIGTTRMGVVKTLIDASTASGRLEVLDAIGTILFSLEITKGALTIGGTVGGGVHTLGSITYVTTTTTVSNSGSASTARVVNGDGTTVISGIEVYALADSSDTYGAALIQTCRQRGVLLPRIKLTAGDTISIRSDMGTSSKFCLLTN